LIPISYLISCMFSLSQAVFLLHHFFTFLTSFVLSEIVTQHHIFRPLPLLCFHLIPLPPLQSLPPPSQRVAASPHCLDSHCYWKKCAPQSLDNFGGC
jgi:hypothetical protein